LGSASDYAVLGLAGTALDNSLVTINGNEGVSAGGTLTNMAPSTVNGNVYEATWNQLTGPGKVTGSTYTSFTTMSTADSAAANAASAAEALTHTQTFGAINNATTITGNGGLNVIAINGTIGNSLTLSGSSSDVFVLLISGDINLNGSESLALGSAVSAANVLYVLTGNDNVTTKVGNTLNGTLLGVNSSFNLDGTFNGEIIGGGKGITLLSGAVVNGIAFQQCTPPPPATAPEPSTMALFGSGLVTAGIVFRRRMRRAEA
jgi:hypothetical protein